MKPTDKQDQQSLPIATTKESKVPTNDSKSYHLDQLQDLATLPTSNKLQLVSQNKEPLSLYQDQLQKQLISMIREVLEQFFEDLKQVIAANDKLSISRKHIPKQKEIDTLLANLCKRVLHNLMVNLDTKDLIEAARSIWSLSGTDLRYS